MVFCIFIQNTYGIYYYIKIITKNCFLYIIGIHGIANNVFTERNRATSKSCYIITLFFKIHGYDMSSHSAGS